MRTRHILLGLLASAALAPLAALADTSFTYQGHIRQSGAPLNGSADFQFRLYTDANAGSQVGPTLTVANLPVVNGLVMTTLDFGADAFDGTPRFLQIGVRSPAGAGVYTPLSPRQAIKPAPYAMRSFNPWATSGDNIHTTNIGNVGIGTNAPTWPLHVIGDPVDDRGIFASGTISASKTSGTPGPGLRVSRTTSVFPLFIVSSLEIDGSRIDGYGTLVGSDGPVRINSLSAGNVLLAEAGGLVGIGTSSPALRLSLVDSGVGIDRPTTNALALYTDATQRLRINSIGDVGIGTTGPNSRLHVNAPDGSNAFRVQVNGTTRLLVHSNGSVAIGANITPQDTLHVSGITRTNSLRIMGGSDLSERFDVAPAGDAKPQPGMVVSIDPANPGKLIASSRAYDRTVAGVISGAGGINSGMIMGQEGSEADGAYPVALTGRVYVLADATTRAIQPGDLLTTSDRAGHAMAVTDHGRANGAIIGKAMTGLAAGETGLVLVLVSLH
jgi:hypothetical protein